MENSALINIGILGDVSNGKSTLVEKLTGVKTQRHSLEKDKNISIKQGYANMKIWKNEDKYYTTNSSIHEHDINDIKSILVNHISFVDCPGHNELILTLLTSMCIMDGIILVISVENDITKKVQLKEQLMAIKLLNIEKIIICMNKIDLVNKNIVSGRKNDLDKLLSSYDIKPLHVIPVSFTNNINIKYVVLSILDIFNIEFCNFKKEKNPIFNITRSFDINKPGINWKDIKGGVIGGSLSCGKLNIGDNITIFPGIDNTPITTNIISIKSENIELDKLDVPGLVGICTNIEPYYCKNDYLKGNFIAIEDDIIKSKKIKIKNYLVNNYINWDPKVNEMIKLIVNSNYYDCKIINIKKNYLEIISENYIYHFLKQNVIICSFKPIKIITCGYIHCE